MSPKHQQEEPQDEQPQADAPVAPEQEQATQEQAQEPTVVLPDLPKGWKFEQSTISAGDVSYPLAWRVSNGTGTERLAAWREHFASNAKVPEGTDIEDAVSGIIASYLDEVQTQRATQGGKGAVRAAKDDDARQKAIRAHQTKAPTFIIGQPAERAGSTFGGLSAKKLAEFGTEVLKAAVARGVFAPSQEDMEQAAAKLGIDLKSVQAAMQAQQQAAQQEAPAA